MNFCETLCNLQTIFEGAFLPSGDDDIDNEQYLQISVETDAGNSLVCLKKNILEMPGFLKFKQDYENSSTDDPKKMKGRINIGIYSCQQCDYEAMKKVKLLAHMEDVHQDTSFYCEHCGQRFKEVNVMKKHILAEHVGVRYTCEECGFQAKRPPDLKHHIDTILTSV